jgi:hypothetical protein
MKVTSIKEIAELAKQFLKFEREIDIEYECCKCHKIEKIKLRSAKSKTQLLCHVCQTNKGKRKRTSEQKIESELLRQKTCLDRYGVDHQRKSKILQEKWKRTNQKKYGVDWAISAPEIMSKIDYNFKHPEGQEKAKQGRIRKYGVPYSMQSPEIKEKYFNTYGGILVNYRYRYNNIWFDSTWEIAYYIWLTDNNIKFEYHPNTPFKYENEKGKLCDYYPDFKINEKYVEIKGDLFFDKDDKPYNKFRKEPWQKKYDALIKNKVIILRYADIKEYIEYVKSTYGRNYLKSFKYEKLT